MDTSKAVDILNDLITKNYDGENGYKEAAEDVDSPTLKNMFNDYAKQRYDFGHELKAAIKQAGGEVEKGGSVAAAIHRTWIDLKSAIAGNDEAAVLEEAKRGEENALKEYDEALSQLNSTDPGYNVVSKQRTQIQQALSQIEQQLSVYSAG